MSSENRTEYGLKCDAQEKHEEIKRMAFKIYLHRTTYNDNPKAFAGFAWQHAEEFYNYAKEKEGNE